MKRFITIFAASLLISACATTSDSLVVDGSNAATTEASLAEIMQPMTEEERLRLFAALLSIQLDGVDTFAEARADQRLETLNFEVLSKHIGGMTLAGILDAAEQSDTTATFESD